MSKREGLFVSNIQYSSVVPFEEYKWIIKNLDECRLDSIDSGEFNIGEVECYDNLSKFKKVPLTWKINLNLMVNQPLRIYLVLKDFKGLEYRTVQIKFAFKIDYDNITVNSILEGRFTNKSLKKLVEGINIKQDNLKNSNLSIAVSILQLCTGYDQFKPRYEEAVHHLQFAIPMPDAGLTNDLKNLMSNEEYSDLILKSKTKKFKAHKIILIARSSYFAAALKNDMKEKQKNIINMVEEDNVIDEILNYIYTGKVENIEGISKDLFIAADKYQLDGLKKICVYELFKKINVENAIEWLLFADEYNDEDFRKPLIKFINFNFKDVSKTESFKSLLIEKPCIAQIFKCLS